jgi:hypothetical protein
MSDKRVHFTDKLFEVYSIENYCRKGHWEECARDRVRFRRRIIEIETAMNPVLNQEHRKKVFKSMYQLEC